MYFPKKYTSTIELSQDNKHIIIMNKKFPIES